jgi:hypothetical protein
MVLGWRIINTKRFIDDLPIQKILDRLPLDYVVSHAKNHWLTFQGRASSFV